MVQAGMLEQRRSKLVVCFTKGIQMISHSGTSSFYPVEKSKMQASRKNSLTIKALDLL